MTRPGKFTCRASYGNGCSCRQSGPAFLCNYGIDASYALCVCASGPVEGTAVVSVSATLGACLAFLVSRYLARPIVEQRIAGKPAKPLLPYLLYYYLQLYLDTRS